MRYGLPVRPRTRALKRSVFGSFLPIRYRMSDVALIISTSTSASFILLRRAAMREG
jgi:hypothetical protein